MAVIKVDVRSQVCPVPLVETRKAIKKAAPGDIVEMTGTDPASLKEIPMAVHALQLAIESIREEGDTWTIRIRV